MQTETETLPVLPVRHVVLFPDTVLPMSVGRAPSVQAVNAAAATEEKKLLVVAQRQGEIEEPTAKDLFEVGTVAVIRRLARSVSGLEVLLQGVARVRIEELQVDGPYPLARVRGWPFPPEDGTEIEALYGSVVEEFSRLAQTMSSQGPGPVIEVLSEANPEFDPPFLIVPLLNLDLVKTQDLLEAPTRSVALQRMHRAVTHQVQVQEMRVQIAEKARSELGEEQRRHMLRRQLRAIQEELKETTPEEQEVQALRERIAEASLPEAVAKEALREADRLAELPSQAPDYQVLRSHLELVLELPWHNATADEIELTHAKEVLDEDHHDLEDVKERILEHLAVMKLNPEAPAPILCFVGPPGTGKTSLGQSIARSMGRMFERMSLGGMHDEAELRGHRRTYVGAMPGRILQAIRRAGVCNPLLMLDEVDKLGRGFHGDPAAALLEVLDPAQNFAFHDNYLDLPFDLSKVFFITTANTLDTVPRPLLDRMEVIHLAGYSTEEKLAIARRFLLPRQIELAGLAAEQMTLADAVIVDLITRYTREAGLRQLDRTLARLARKVARRVAEGQAGGAAITSADLGELLGPEPFQPEQARASLAPGVAVGLAWTEVGGEVLYVEALLLPEGRDLVLTGSLGDVMKESARAAQSYLWSRADELGLDRKCLKSCGVHIHVPAGAVPKDGPSAGVTMATSLASLYSGRSMQAGTAMTGEITLAGLVLPIGGVKEKVLAAHRAGIHRIIMPRGNEQHLRKLSDEVRREMEFVLVDTIAGALEAALVAPATGKKKKKKKASRSARAVSRSR